MAKTLFRQARTIACGCALMCVACAVAQSGASQRDQRPRPFGWSIQPSLYSDRTPLAEDPRRAWILDEEEPPESFMFPHVPVARSIGEKELDAYLTLIEPSEEQEQFLRARYATYREQDAELRRAKEADLWRFAAELVKHRRLDITVTDAQTVAMTEELVEDAQRIARELEQQEEVFFAVCREVLTEEQQAGLEHARQWRARWRHASKHPPKLGAAQIDLVLLMHELREEGDPLEPTDESVWEDLWRNYDATVASAWNRYQRVKQDAEAEHTRLRSQSHDAINVIEAAETPADVNIAAINELQAISDRIRALKKDETEAELRLHERVDAFASRFQEILDEGDAARWRKLYRARAYPMLFPTPFDLEEFLTVLPEQVEASDAQREQLALLDEQHLPQFKRIEEQLIERYLGWRKTFSLQGYARGSPEAYREDMAPLQRQRLAAVNAALRDAEVILDQSDPWLEKQRARFTQTVSDWEPYLDLEKQHGGWPPLE